MKYNYLVYKLPIGIWDLLFLLNVPTCHNHEEFLSISQIVGVRKGRNNCFNFLSATKSKIGDGVLEF